MTRRVAYKGYIIEAQPSQLADDLRWILSITIERHEGDRVIELPHCINFGRQIIDGQVPSCTAP